MDVVQALDNLQQAIVSGLLDRLVDLSLVLLVGLPCDSGCLSGRKLGKKLVFAEEAREVEQIVGIARCRGEIAGRCWDNADALEKEVHWLGSATARRRATTRRRTTTGTTTSWRTASGDGEARLALRGAACELVLILGELYRASCSDGLLS